MTAVDDLDLRQLADALPNPIYLVDADGTFLLANEAAATLHGTTVEAIEGATVTTVLGETQGTELQGQLTAVLETGEQRRGADIEATVDGSTRVFQPRLVPVDLGDRQVEVVLGAAVDVTRERRRERRLGALNETTRGLLGAASREHAAELGVAAAADVLGLEANAIHFYDADAEALVPVAATDEARALVGDPPALGPDDSIAWHVWERGESVAVDDVRDHPEAHNPESPVRSELYLPIDDHGLLIAGSTAVEAFDEEDVALGEVLARSLAAVLDGIDRRERLFRRERELRQQNERLEAFARTVGHDLRNPLSVTDGRIDLAREATDDPEVATHLDAAAQAVERTEELVEDLLALARGESDEAREAVELAAFVRECWANVDTGEATLEVRTDRSVVADRSRLKQLVENLVGNAVAHAGDAATVTVGDLPDGFYVADDGPGVPAEVRDRVFEVGYTTASTGTGFGLSIVAEIAEDHDWTVEMAESESGGTQVELRGVRRPDEDAGDDGTDDTDDTDTDDGGEHAA